MGNHDLLSDDDFFAKSKSIKKDTKDKKKDIYSEEEDFFRKKESDESVLELKEIESSLQERPDAKSQSKKDAQDFFKNIQENLEMEDQSREKKGPAAEVATRSLSNKEDIKYKKVYFDIDDKQEKISYRPVIIGVILVVILLVGGYFVYQWLFAGKFSGSQPATIQPVTTEPPMESVQAPQEDRKTEYLSRLAGRTNRELSSLSDIINTAIKSSKLSSILLYDSDLMFEVFSNSREELARLNINLKDSYRNQQFRIVSSSQRAGENGGILGIYSVKLDQAGTERSAVALKLGDVREAEQWLQGIFGSQNLKISALKSRSSFTAEMFTVHEIEASGNGTMAACIKVLHSLAVAGSNVKIHKLTCNAVDQKNFSSGNYQLKLLLRIYV